MKEIPKVDRVLAWPEIRALLARQPRPEVLSAVRTVLVRLRERVKSDGSAACCDPGRIAGQVAELLAARSRHSLRPVINGSGVVVHTNLGRCPLGEAAWDALAVAAAEPNTPVVPVMCQPRS